MEFLFDECRSLPDRHKDCPGKVSVGKKDPLVVGICCCQCHRQKEES